MSAARELVERTCRAQGLPVVLDDATAITVIAAALKVGGGPIPTGPDATCTTTAPTGSSTSNGRCRAEGYHQD